MHYSYAHTFIARIRSCSNPNTDVKKKQTAKDVDGQVTQREHKQIYTGNLCLLLVKEMQIKVTWISYCIPNKIAHVFKMVISIAGVVKTNLPSALICW